LLEPSLPNNSRRSIESHTWLWRGFAINYQFQGDRGVPVLLIHGFGASVGHWRKNIPILAQNYRCYAIDLIGFGASSKPAPGTEIEYTMETWGQLVVDFCREVIGAPTILIANSIGCVVAMQAAVIQPDLVTGTILLDCSLRLLHDRKIATLPWYRRQATPILQRVLTIPAIGNFFFSQLAKSEVVSKILRQAYGDPQAVTDELIEILLAPARDPGAAAVFLAFTAYSQGPIPEDLLPQLTCPVAFLWGEVDPWEPIDLGRELAKFPCVRAFIPLPGVGHCPQDEAPDLVNPLLLTQIANFIAGY
jgi:pimeloyl-ACP methyl ester carboxylesterase